MATVFPTADDVKARSPWTARCLAWLGADGWPQGLVILALTAFALVACVRIFERVIPSVDNGWAIYWPHNGIVAAVLLMQPRRRWKWIFAGYLCAFGWVETLRSDTPGEPVMDVAMNGVEILIAVFALPAFRDLGQWLTEPSLVRRFTAAVIVGGPALTCLPIGLYYSHFYPVRFWQPALQWAFADALGAALWLPLTLVLFSRETYTLFHWRKLPETLLLLGGLCGVAWLTFHQQRYPLSFLPYPLLLYVALRLGFSGAVIGTNLLTLVVAGLSAHGYGAFHVSGKPNDPQVVVIQVFSTLAILFVFPLSVALVERRNFERKLREAYADMKRQATIDPLTQVANRRHFDQVLKTEWARAVRTRTPLGLLMIDADFFKAYNDRYGHVGGDECLRQIAATLSAGAPRGQDLVARYGGEEFAVLMPGMRPEYLAACAEAIRAAVEALGIVHEGHPLGTVTLSIGCCVAVPTLELAASELIDAADRALYAAKQQGRNCVVVATEPVGKASVDWPHPLPSS